MAPQNVVSIGRDSEQSLQWRYLQLVEESSTDSRWPKRIKQVKANDSFTAFVDTSDLLHVYLRDKEITIFHPYTEADGTRGSLFTFAFGDQNWRQYLLTAGTSPSSPQPLLRVWLLTESGTGNWFANLVSETRLPDPGAQMLEPMTLSVDRDMDLVFLTYGCQIVLFKKVGNVVKSSRQSLSTQSSPVSLGKGRVVWRSREKITNGAIFQDAKLLFFITTDKSVRVIPINAEKHSFLEKSLGFSSRAGTGPQPFSTSENFGYVLDSNEGAEPGNMAVVNGGDEAQVAVARSEGICLYSFTTFDPIGKILLKGKKLEMAALPWKMWPGSDALPSSFIACLVSQSSDAEHNSLDGVEDLLSRTSLGLGGVSYGTLRTSLYILDPSMNVIAFYKTFNDDNINIWTSDAFQICSGNTLFSFKEKDLLSNLDALLSQKLFAMAIAFGESRKLPTYRLAQMYRLYGDFLYDSRNDFSLAMEIYIKTIGIDQPSYVIRRFLDAQLLPLLVKFLESLHEKRLASTAHTTLLILSYVKLNMQPSLAKFIDDCDRQSFPFDAETAIQLCHQSGYNEHALWLAKKAGAHVSVVQLEILASSFPEAFDYIRTLDSSAAVDCLSVFAPDLLRFDSITTSSLIFDLCIADHASIVQFFVLFADASLSLVSLIERILLAKYGIDMSLESLVVLAEPKSASTSKRSVSSKSKDKDSQSFSGTQGAQTRSSLHRLPVSDGLTGEPSAFPDSEAIANTLLSLYVSFYAQDEDKGKWESRALRVLKHPAIFAYNANSAILQCAQNDFLLGLIEIYRQLGAFDKIINLLISRAKSHPNQKDLFQHILLVLEDVGSSELYLKTLKWIASQPDKSDDVKLILDKLKLFSDVSPVAVIEALTEAENPELRVEVVHDYLTHTLKANAAVMTDNITLAKSHRTESLARQDANTHLRKSQRMIQDTLCSSCNEHLDLPSVFFMCDHAYHERCLVGDSCPQCAESHDLVKSLEASQMALAKNHDLFYKELLTEADDRFAVIARAFGKGYIQPADSF